MYPITREASIKHAAIRTNYTVTSNLYPSPTFADQYDFNSLLIFQDNKMYAQFCKKKKKKAHSNVIGEARHAIAFAVRGDFYTPVTWC